MTLLAHLVHFLPGLDFLTMCFSCFYSFQRSLDIIQTIGYGPFPIFSVTLPYIKIKLLFNVFL